MISTKSTGVTWYHSDFSAIQWAQPIPLQRDLDLSPGAKGEALPQVLYVSSRDSCRSLYLLFLYSLEFSLLLISESLVSPNLLL